MPNVFYPGPGRRYGKTKFNCLLLLLILLAGCCLESRAGDAFNRMTNGTVPLTDVFNAPVTIHGRVLNDKKQPMEGVSITEKGTTNSTVTDAKGNYTITVADNNASLVFSYIGYTNEEIRVGSRTTIDLTMENSIAKLDDVVVVGYGSQKRKDITGSVVSVDTKRLENMPNTNFTQALEGAVPGLTISTNSAGAEGNNQSLLIRGKNSIGASTTPLIILDGIPFNGGMTDIVPADIESIEVLKDASAAAIYGSRASNGVILITSKKGLPGKAVISYDVFTGVQKIVNLPNILSPEQFYAYKQFREPGSITASEQKVYDSKIFPNWMALGTQTGRRTQHTLGLRGGSGSTRYYASVQYLDVKGVAVNDNFKRLSSRINLETTFAKWITYGTNTQLNYDDRKGEPATFGGPGTAGVYMMNPLTTAYDSLGKLTIYPWPDDQSFANPLSPTLAKSKDDSYKLFTNNYLQFKLPFLPGFSYRLNTGVEYQTRNTKTYYGRDTRQGAQRAGDYNGSTKTAVDYTIENVVNYDHTFGKHSISFTGLYSYQYDRTETDGIAAQNFPDDVLSFYQANVALSITPSSGYIKTTQISQMARINYGYNSKYLLTLTGRRDGYSGFGINNKFAFFPSAAVAWNITEEPFMQHNKIVTNLKLRVSYGSNGNQAVDPYQTLAKLTSRPYVNGSTTAPGYVPASLAFPDLKWETTDKADIGLDFGLLNGRIQGSIDAYTARTHDLLLSRSISSVNGVNSMLVNIGKTSNQGMELGLTAKTMERRNFSWTTNANISFNRNKIIDLYGDKKSDTASGWFIGKPVDVNFGYVYNGVWQSNDDLTKSPQPGVKPGYAKVLDVNGDGVINSYDRTIIGSEQPLFSWGLANTFRYRQLQLYVFIHGVQGTRQPNTLLTDNVNTGVRYNTNVKNWWTVTNPTNDYYANVIGANAFGAQIYENSSFLRVKDIMLSYDFSDGLLKRTGLSKFRIYVETRNPFTITKWSGLDPELDSQGGIPLQKEFLIGASISL